MSLRCDRSSRPELVLPVRQWRVQGPGQRCAGCRPQGWRASCAAAWEPRLARPGPNARRQRAEPKSRQDAHIAAERALAATVTGGDRNDVTRLLSLIQAVPPVQGKRGRPRQRPAVLYADRGYDMTRTAARSATWVSARSWADAAPSTAADAREPLGRGSRLRPAPPSAAYVSAGTSGPASTKLS